jgi:hypothetical protein
MGNASRLFLAAAGAASLIVACVIPWQDTANLESPLPQGDVSMTPRGDSGPVAAVPLGQTSSRAGVESDEAALLTEVATVAPRTALGSLQKAPPLPADRLWLGRELQRELARVGCYEGELNGVWTPAARKAMKAFTDRVNATLPTDEPDYILLTLVQGSRDKVCGMTCPVGQALAEGGRCVPNAVLAAKKPPQVTRAAPLHGNRAPASTVWSLARTPAPGTPPSTAGQERMGLAGPPAPTNSGLVDGQPSLAGLSAPAQPVPAPAAAAAPGAPRPAVPARRAATSPATFGPAIFRVWDGWR